MAVVLVMIAELNLFGIDVYRIQIAVHKAYYGLMGNLVMVEKKFRVWAQQVWIFHWVKLK